MCKMNNKIQYILQLICKEEQNMVFECSCLAIVQSAPVCMSVQESVIVDLEPIYMQE